MKPWREVAAPHTDVLGGTFLQSEFAADITAVRDGKAMPEYQDAARFFERTFVTEGMRLLLVQVAHRLNGHGGEPVIQLQTAFGGGKTHTMLAVFHLTTRKCELTELAGIPAVVEQAGLKDVPHASVAVLDGTAHAPGQPWRHGKQAIRTLWGELAWQLGKDEGYARVKESDVAGTSPGKNVLQDLLEAYAPCVILIDELVAYVRQFAEGATLTGGTFDSNISFIQALTEAAKLVPTAIILGSLPESEIEAGSQRGVVALRSLEKCFGRVQALWKPVATEEAFEIVRRRLFEPVRDEAAREAVCRAFADAYLAEGTRLPTETQETRYSDRLRQAYPIHPEVFDRLYEDWTTIDGFQRTRGVLKLMAKVIHRLWKDENKDLMIMPGSLPLYDSGSRNELTYYLNAGWDAVLEKDIDGDRAETSELENREPRFGAISAARRVARTIFLGSAPSAVSTKSAIRGIDRARILLGCLQPGQAASTYSDALNRLVTEKLHYLHRSDDKAHDATRYWFDTRATLRREMEDRKQRFDDLSDVRVRVAAVLKKLTNGASLFEGVHVFTPHADVPDDGALRLVLLSPDQWYSRDESRLAFEAVQDCIRNNGTKPRHRGNRLVFLAPEHASHGRLNDCVRIALAWESIVEDAADGRLNIDLLQQKHAKKELQVAEDVLPRVARECYKWLLCPGQDAATDPKVTIEALPLNTSGSVLNAEIERVCIENELVISTWSPIHLRAKLAELYWKAEKPAAGAMAFWEDTLRYLYLPRLRTRSVLEQAIIKGAGSRDFFGTAYGQQDGKFDGFKLGDANIQFDGTLLLIEPSAANAYDEALKARIPRGTEGSEPLPLTNPPSPPVDGRSPHIHSVVTTPGSGLPKAHTFIGTAEVKAATAKVRLVQIADEIITLLTSDPTATVNVTLEITADFPAGVSETTKRAVSENATSLGFKNKTWE